MELTRITLITEARHGKFAHIMDPDGNKLELWEPMIFDGKNKA